MHRSCLALDHRMPDPAQYVLRHGRAALGDHLLIRLGHRGQEAFVAGLIDSCALPWGAVLDEVSVRGVLLVQHVLAGLVGVARQEVHQLA